MSDFQWRDIMTVGADIALDSGHVVHVTCDVDVREGTGRGRPLQATFRLYFKVAMGPAVYEWIAHVRDVQDPADHEIAAPHDMLAFGHAMYFDGRYYRAHDDGPEHLYRAAGRAALVVSRILQASSWDRRKAEREAIEAYRKGRK